MKHKQKRSPLLRFWNFLLLAVILGAMLFSTASRDAMRLIDTYRYPRRYAEYVSEASERFGVEENMIYAIIKAESGFRATVVSRAGAIGLMQVIPDTFLFDIREKIDMAESPSSVLFSARENILAGTYYYSYLRKHFGAEREALAAYNAGIGNVTRWLADPAYADLKGLIPDAIPIAETRAYIARVQANKAHYDDLYGKQEIADTRNLISQEQCYAWAQIYGAKYRIDPRFVMAVIATESSFDAADVSTSGSIGLMQLKEDTYREDIQANLHLEEEFDALFDAEFNIQCGTYYLHWLDDRLDGFEQLAAAYNGGIGNVREWLKDERYSEDGVTLILDAIPREETRRYVAKVMANYEKYCARYPDAE